MNDSAFSYFIKSMADNFIPVISSGGAASAVIILIFVCMYFAYLVHKLKKQLLSIIKDTKTDYKNLFTITIDNSEKNMQEVKGIIAEFSTTYQKLMAKCQEDFVTVNDKYSNDAKDLCEVAILLRELTAKFENIYRYIDKKD